MRFRRASGESGSERQSARGSARDLSGLPRIVAPAFSRRSSFSNRKRRAHRRDHGWRTHAIPRRRIARRARSAWRGRRRDRRRSACDARAQPARRARFARGRRRCRHRWRRREHDQHLHHGSAGHRIRRYSRRQARQPRRIECLRERRRARGDGPADRPLARPRCAHAARNQLYVYVRRRATIRR